MKQASLFSQKVRELAREIPAGMVTTYGLIARAAGAGGQAARSISAILGRDPDHTSIPWHRIVYSSGKVWLNEQCHPERMKLYKKEKIEVDKNGKIKNFRDVLYTFGE